MAQLQALDVLAVRHLRQDIFDQLPTPALLRFGATQRATWPRANQPYIAASCNCSMHYPKPSKGLIPRIWSTTRVGRPCAPRRRETL